MPAELSLFLITLNSLVMSKTIRYYAMRYYRGVTFCDFRDAALLAAGALCLIDLFGVVGSILVWVLLSIFTIILLSDAVLFNRYSFTINPSALKIFANNCNAFLDESDRFFNYVKKRKFYLYPLLSCLHMRLPSACSSKPN